jgi:hypothetical protein
MAVLSGSYRALVQKLTRERTGEPVFNTSLEHAAVLIEAMFHHGRSSVDILTGKFNPRVYGREDVVEQARLFLAEPERKVRVLMEDSSEEAIKEHPFFAAFSDNSNLQVRLASPQFASVYKFHFTVMDGDSYRFERDKESPAAVAAFGDTEGAASMATLFDAMWAVSEPIELPKARAATQVSAAVAIVT